MPTKTDCPGRTFTSASMHAATHPAKQKMGKRTLRRWPWAPGNKLHLTKKSCVLKKARYIRSRQLMADCALVGLAGGRLVEAVLSHGHQLVGRQALHVGGHLRDPALDLLGSVRLLIARLVHQVPRCTRAHKHACQRSMIAYFRGRVNGALSFLNCRCNFVF